MNALFSARSDIAVVILAAGWSSRMGALKPLLPFGASSVVGHVIATAQAAAVGPVYVVVGHEAARVAPVVEALGATAVVNGAFAQGMLSSVQAGLAALPASVAGALILPVDVPLIRAASLAAIAHAAARGDADLLRPTFRGEPGHPPFLHRRLFADILAAPVDTSLRDHLARHAAHAATLPLIDSGLTRDMDTPDAYQGLFDALPGRAHPDDTECEAMLEAAATPEPIRRHGRAVATLAVDLATRLTARGVPLDLDLVRAGALLHDIAKGEPEHATAGARRVAAFGFAKTAAVVAAHMEVPFDASQPLDERHVVFLADKLVRGEARIALEERFAPALAAFADDPAALAGAHRRRAAALALRDAVTAQIGPLDAPAACSGTRPARPAAAVPVARSFGHTESVCPTCLKTIPAERVAVGDTVYLDKTCPEHGRVVTPIWRGVESYEIWAGSPRATATPLRTATTNADGCPRDCGLCPEHQQQGCCVLIEVTSRCDLVCPVCFASAGRHGTDRPIAEIAATLDALRAGSGQVHLQLSGGEPTVRDDLPEIVALARAKGFQFVQLNSNGLRIGREPDYLAALAKAGLDCVFLQFDGVSDAVYRSLRGRDLLADKRRAIASARAANLGVVLVPTVVPGVNAREIGAIVDFAIAEMPTVRAVHFQPIAYFGRTPTEPNPSDRITLPEVMQALIDHADGAIRLADFHPGSAENPTCSFSGRFSVDHAGRLHADPEPAATCCGEAVPATSTCCGTAARRSPDVVRAQRYVAGQWARAPQDDTPAPGLEAFDAVLDRQARRLSLSGMAFQDAWTLDLDRLRQCYIHVATPNGRAIPFCAYNLTDRAGHTLYRGQAQ